MTYRWVKPFFIVTATIVTLACSAVPFVAPAVAAYGCPACYGLERAGDGIYVGRDMPKDVREALAIAVARATTRVENVYGSFDARPTLLACSTSECDRRMGGRGALAVTYGSLFIMVSPLGINETILAHEFSHVQLAAWFGPIAMLRGDLPAWFNEGIAVIVSNDDRYLAPGTTATERCRAEPKDDARISFFAWGSVSAMNQGLYAQAACRVMRWLEANGGTANFRSAIVDVAKGRVSLP